MNIYFGEYIILFGRIFFPTLIILLEKTLLMDHAIHLSTVKTIIYQITAKNGVSKDLV